MGNMRIRTQGAARAAWAKTLGPSSPGMRPPHKKHVKRRLGSPVRTESTNAHVPTTPSIAQPSTPLAIVNSKISSLLKAHQIYGNDIKKLPRDAREFYMQLLKEKQRLETQKLISKKRA